MSFKPYTEKIKKKKIGIFSVLGRIRIRIQNRTGSGSIILQADPRIRIRIKMIRTLNTVSKTRLGQTCYQKSSQEFPPVFRIRIIWPDPDHLARSGSFGRIRIHFRKRLIWILLAKNKS